MTNEEVNLLKQAILDSTEAYVDTRFERLPFVKTEIGVIEGVGTNKGNKVRLNKVVKNGEVIKEGILYDDVLSVGNIIFPNGSIVYIFVPNAQYNNMFIMGQLDDTPANIKGGTINIGNGSFMVDNNGNVTLTKGSINLGNGSFVVDINGNVTLAKGSINLGNGSFMVDNNGNVTMTKGQINIANNFIVNNVGDTKINGSLYMKTPYDGEGMNWKVISTKYESADDNTLYFNDIHNQPFLIWGEQSGVVFPNAVTFNNNVYNSTGGIAFVSDKNAKHDIKSLDLEESANFIYAQNPVSYKFNNGTSNREHHGFIAQEVKETMGNKDWGIYIDKKINDKNVNEEEFTKGLRYDEYIADIIATCQYQKQQIDEMKKEIKKLQNKLEVKNNGND